MISAAVAGASGYAGGEILRLLLQHPDVRIGALTAASSAGTQLGEHHQHLGPLADRVVQPTTTANLAGHDVVFLALPHGESGPVAAQLADSVRVIDCGADFRLEDAAAWQKYYGGEHAGTWAYGLPELIRAQTGGEHAEQAQLAQPQTLPQTLPRQRDVLAHARRIAVPGCNVTAVTLALQPAICTGIIENQDVVAVLANGYSGAGKAMKPHLMASEGLGSATAYGVGGTHRHIPEIVQNLQSAGASDVTISFTPTLVPMSRGILATVSARLTAVNADLDESIVRQCYEESFAEEPFVQLLPHGQQPATAATVGSNLALVQVSVDHDAGRLVITCAIDNLGKGTAGGAIQSMNLACGIAEATGLPLTGVKP